MTLKFVSTTTKPVFWDIVEPDCADLAPTYAIHTQHYNIKEVSMHTIHTNSEYYTPY